jgi:hypothetical protein
MPHAQLPIGPEGTSDLECFIDTGAGVNLGRLDFHQQFVSTHPELVKTFHYIEDGHDLHHLELTSIDEEITSTLRLMAVVEYHTPYEVDGQPLTLTIGLARSTAANTILGLPFLQESRATFSSTPEALA